MKKLISILIAIVFVGTILVPIVTSAQNVEWANFQQREWARFQLWDPHALKHIDTTKYKKNPPYTIVYVDCSVSNVWAAFTAQEYKAEAERWKVKGVIKGWFHTDAQDKPDKQIADIEDMMVKKVDLMIIRPATEAALDPIVTKVHREGVPVICLSRRIKSDNFISHVVTSNFASARVMMVWLAQMLKGKGNIVMLWGKEGSSTVAERMKGAKEALSQYPGIKVLDEQHTGWSAARGKSVMQAMIQSFGKKINGVFSDYGLEGMGAIEALHEAGMKVPITGDTINGFMSRVQKWGFPAVVVGYSPMMGGDSVKLGLKILQGIPVPFSYQAPGIVIATHDTPDVKSEMGWKDFALMDKADDYYPDNNLRDEIGKKFMP